MRAVTRPPHRNVVLELTFERRIFARDTGAVDEFMTCVLRNRGDAEIDVDGKWLHFTVTSSSDCEFVAAHDTGTGGVPEGKVGPWDGRFLVGLQVRGNVEAHATRIIGIHLRRSDTAFVTEGEITLRDPTGFHSTSDWPLTRTTWEVSVTFPEDGVGRELITGRSGTPHTSRTAEWKFAHLGPRMQLIEAKCRRQYVPANLRTYDDLIAGLLERIGRRAAGTLSEADARAIVLRATERHASLIADASGALTEPVDLSDLDAITDKSQRELRHSVRLLMAARKLVEGMTRTPRADSQISDIRDKLYMQAIEEHSKAGATSPIPEQFADCLHNLLRFANERRNLGSSLWGDAPTEKVLHDKLEEFMRASNQKVDRELNVANGRLDLLLSGTPVELKGAELSLQPIDSDHKYAQQAADYGAQCHSGVVVLMVLDTTKHDGARAPRPHLLADTDVAVVESRSSLRVSKTVVVIIVLHAFPPVPSSLIGSTTRRRKTKPPLS